MAKAKIESVVCPNCGRTQWDRGERATCSYCGFSPLPSYCYPRTSAFHPRHKTAVGNGQSPLLRGGGK